MNASIIQLIYDKSRNLSTHQYFDIEIDSMWMFFFEIHSWDNFKHDLFLFLVWLKIPSVIIDADPSTCDVIIKVYRVACIADTCIVIACRPYWVSMNRYREMNFSCTSVSFSRYSVLCINAQHCLQPNNTGSQFRRLKDFHSLSLHFTLL